MKIKICGITKEAEAEYLNEAQVDYAGFVFYEKSKRYITPLDASEVMKRLNPNIKKVAVTVSPDANLINQIQTYNFDVIQIHKELSEEALRAARLPVWYAVNISDEEELIAKEKELENLPLVLSCKISALLVDAPDFGSGKPFNWKKSKRLKKAGAQSPPFSGKEFILAGGLSSDNVLEGIEIFEPDCVDVSSSVEGNNGKDRELIMEFVNKVRSKY